MFYVDEGVGENECVDVDVGCFVVEGFEGFEIEVVVCCVWVRGEDYV